MIFFVSSDPTANLFWHSCTENLVSVWMSSPDTPMTVAFRASNFWIDSAKVCASMEQLSEKAAGKKYNTTGPLASASGSEKLKTLPPSAAWVTKGGAVSPKSSAALAGSASDTA